MSEVAKSGDGTVANVGIKLDGTVNCTHCNQKFTSQAAMQLHLKSASVLPMDLHGFGVLLRSHSRGDEMQRVVSATPDKAPR